MFFYQPITSNDSQVPASDLTIKTFKKVPHDKQTKQKDNPTSHAKSSEKVERVRVPRSGASFIKHIFVNKHLNPILNYMCTVKPL